MHVSSSRDWRWSLTQVQQDFCFVWSSDMPGLRRAWLGRDSAEGTYLLKWACLSVSHNPSIFCSPMRPHKCCTLYSEIKAARRQLWKMVEWTFHVTGWWKKELILYSAKSIKFINIVPFLTTSIHEWSFPRKVGGVRGSQFYNIKWSNRKALISKLFMPLQRQCFYLSRQFVNLWCTQSSSFNTKIP